MGGENATKEAKKRYCIFNGSIASINSTNNGQVLITDDYSEQYVMEGQVALIPDELFSTVEVIINEQTSLRLRMERLDREYDKKKEALRELWMQAREKEISFINKLIQKNKNVKGEIYYEKHFG